MVRGSRDALRLGDRARGGLLGVRDYFGMDDYGKGISRAELCDHCELTFCPFSNRGTTAPESTLI
jgi:hypothetical protein